MKTKIITIQRLLTSEIALYLFLFFVILFAPFIGFQPITGTLVNASLFLSVIFLGVKAGVVLALFPSVVALFTGILPMSFFPFVPFIITGNVLLVFVFHFFKEHYFQGVFLSSFVKFSFLTFFTLFIGRVLFHGKEIAQISQLMGWSQLFTAIGGGIFAYLVMKIQKK